jgi:hypothetical protein
MAGFKKGLKSLLKVGLVLAAVLLMMTAGSARADIALTIIDAGVLQPGGDFLYTYNVQLTPGPGGSVLSSAGGGVNTGFSPSNNFFTLYDVQGLVPGSETFGGILGVAGNAAAKENLTGVTPPTQTPADSGSILNITTFWTGASTPTAPDQMTTFDLGTFSFLSTNPLGSTMLEYSAATQALKGFPVAIANNTSMVAGPGPGGPPPPIPEPGTLMLLAIGLPVLGGYCYRRNA